MGEEYVPGKSSRLLPILYVLNVYGPLSTKEIAMNLNTEPKKIWSRIRVYWHEYNYIKVSETVREKRKGRPTQKYELTQRGKDILSYLMRLKSQNPDEFGRPHYDRWKNPDYQTWLKRKEFV